MGNSKAAEASGNAALGASHHEDDAHYLRVLVGKPGQMPGDDPGTPRWIATEPGVALRFIGERDAS